MANKSHNSSEAVDLNAFVSPCHYIVGAGETIDDVQVTGEWVATDSPMDVRR